MASILEEIQKEALQVLRSENNVLSTSDEFTNTSVVYASALEAQYSSGSDASKPETLNSEKQPGISVYDIPSSTNEPAGKQSPTKHKRQTDSGQKTTASEEVDHEKDRAPVPDQRKYLFVEFPGKFVGMNLEGYLKNRIEGAKHFKCVHLPTKPEAETTTVRLEFNNMRSARTVAWKLKKSNQGENMTKLKCYFDANEIKATANAAEITEKVKRCKSELYIRKYQHLQRHDGKISDLERRPMQVRKHIPLDEFDRVTAERKALDDKLQELRLQRDEFSSYVDKSIFSEIKKCGNFDNKMVQLRLQFGIEMGRLENALPIYARRQEILNVVSKHQVSVILGETGSGKSTQMTQYLLEAGLADSGMIACTQPRKIAATSLATRVSSELLSSVGQTVGYKVGMRVKTSSMTKIVYLTDHMLLNEILNDRILSKYACVVIDEAHERSIYTDLLLGMIKQCLEIRPDLKILITSATIDPKLFVRYFNGCPVVNVSGRTFPVDVVWIDEGSSFENHIQSAVQTVVTVHETENEGDILVFLTSPLETEKCCTMVQGRLSHRYDYKCLQLHGKLQAVEQQAVFDPLPLGKRKIVFATNSAETSVTIPGIKYVVDTGLVKEMRFDAKKKMSSLDVAIISKSSAEQRKGRAGRTSPGKCFRLYSEEEFEQMETGSLPEILRVHLAQALLKLLELDVDPLTFDFVQSPSEASMKSAMASLESIGAVKERRITELGKKLSLLPFDPRLSKLVLMGLEEDIAYEAICLAALVNAGSSIFFRAGTEQEKNKSDLRKTRFCHPDGDHLTLLSVYEEWFNVPEKEKSKWCMDNSINARAIRTVRETANEVVTTIKKELNLEVKVHITPTSTIRSKIKDIIFDVSKENIAFYLGHPKAGYIVPRQNQQAQIHPSSSLNVLGGVFPEWITFEQHINTSRDFLTTVSPISRALVLGAFERGEIQFNLAEVEKLKLSPFFIKELGSQLFRKFVGPLFRNLHTIEEELSTEMQGALAYIDADADKLMIQVYTNGGEETTVNQVINRHLTPSLKQLLSGDKEIPLNPKGGDVRVVIGCGAELSAILFSSQYRKIFVESVPEGTDATLVKQLFSEHGKVIDCTPLRRPNPNHPARWGTITFERPSEAVEAVAQRKDSLTAKASAPVSTNRNVKSRDFTLKLTWIRRQPRGFGFIHFSRPEDLEWAAIHLNPIEIDEQNVSISLDMKTRDSIYMRNLPSSATEEKVVRAVNKCFSDTVYSVVEKVAIIRKAEFSTSEEDLQLLQQELHNEILGCVPGIKADIQFIPPKPKNIFYTAFVRFPNPNEGVKVYNSIHNAFYVIGEKVEVVQDLSVEIFVPKYLQQILCEELETMEQKLKRDSRDGSFHITTNKSKAGHSYVTLKSESTKTLVRVKHVYDSLLAGEVIDCKSESSGDNLRDLFGREGKARLLDIEKRTNTVIRSDYHMSRITVIGNPNIRQNAIKQVRQYIGVLKASTRRVELKGKEKPKGLMKHMLKTYGTDLQTLKQKAKVNAIELDFRRQILTIRGTDDSVQKTVDLIQGFTDHLATDLPTLREDESVECVVCLQPIGRGELYRLSLCTHAYCLECARRQLQTAVNFKDIPMQCAAEDCKQLWCWNDIEEIAGDGTTTIRQIVSASVSCFVLQNKDQYQYCLTPDCPIIFPVSKDGKLFICEACGMRICTSCKVQNHDGLTCAMYMGAGRIPVVPVREKHVAMSSRPSWTIHPSDTHAHKPPDSSRDASSPRVFTSVRQWTQSTEDPLERSTASNRLSSRIPPECQPTSSRTPAFQSTSASHFQHDHIAPEPHTPGQCPHYDTLHYGGIPLSTGTRVPPTTGTRVPPTTGTRILPTTGTRVPPTTGTRVPPTNGTHPSASSWHPLSSTPARPPPPSGLRPPDLYASSPSRTTASLSRPQAPQMDRNKSNPTRGQKMNKKDNGCLIL